MRAISLVFAATLLVCSTAAADSFKTADLLAIQDHGDEVDRLFLESYIVGLAEGVEMSHQVASGAGVALFCPTEALSFGGDLVMDVLREQVAWHPEAAVMEPRVVFFAGLINRYPCEDQQVGQLSRPQ